MARPKKYLCEGNNISIYLTNEAQAKLKQLSIRKHKSKSEIINSLIIDDYSKEKSLKPEEEVSNILYNILQKE